jgi:hypothetical protein
MNGGIFKILARYTRSSGLPKVLGKAYSPKKRAYIQESG